MSKFRTILASQIDCGDQIDVAGTTYSVRYVGTLTIPDNRIQIGAYPIAGSADDYVMLKMNPSATMQIRK